MAVLTQTIGANYALYNADCCEVLASLPSASVHLSIYSPPFCGLYKYSSSERDLSNCRTYQEFFDHYRFVVRELHRLTLPGRVTAVHCMDVPRDGANLGGGLTDFPGDIIRLHEEEGFYYAARYCVWKEPLGVRNRTMAKGLAHKQIVEDSTLCDVANADYLLMFRKKGTNPIPVAHPTGLSTYAGAREIPKELLQYRNWPGKQTENRLSHWIWRQYASAFWDDIRIDRVLPHLEARDPEDERHIHPLQLDVIERCITLWSNPRETVLTPFMGVGSEVYGALSLNRRAIGAELKSVYFRQAVLNVESLERAAAPVVVQGDLFAEEPETIPIPYQNHTETIPPYDPQPGTCFSFLAEDGKRVCGEVLARTGDALTVQIASVEGRPMRKEVREYFTPGDWPAFEAVMPEKAQVAA